MLLKVQDALDEPVDAGEFQALMDYFLNEQRPYNFDPYDPGNVLRDREVNFMDMVNSMEDSGAQGAARLTEFAFYSKIRYFEKKHARTK